MIKKISTYYINISDCNIKTSAPLTVFSFEPYSIADDENEYKTVFITFVRNRAEENSIIIVLLPNSVHVYQCICMHVFWRFDFFDMKYQWNS